MIFKFTLAFLISFISLFTFANPTALPPGNYTIDNSTPTGGMNYNTFSEAITALATGVTGPVVFDVANNVTPYTEQLTLPAVTGASAVNTITFNGNGSTLQFNATSANKFIFQLNGADFVTLNNLVIKTTNATYGWGILLRNGADNNVINGCTIDMSLVTSTTAANSVGIVATNSVTSVTTGASNANNCTISNNTTIGGTNGIRFYGGTATTARNNNNSITNNTVTDFYDEGIYTIYSTGFTINDNDISRLTRTSVTTFSGVYLSTSSLSFTIDGNRIHDSHTGDALKTSGAYGIYISSSDAPSGTPTIVSNNLIYNINNNSGLAYGIYNTSSDNVSYYHNTVIIDNPTATSTSISSCFYQVTAAIGLDIKNNIFYMDRGGTGNTTCLYFSTASPTYTSDYNDLVNAGTASNNNIAYVNPNFYSSLSTYQTGESKDLNSLSIVPAYVDASTGNYKPITPALNDKGTSVGILLDILNVSRSISTPDLGAYEFSVAGCAAPPTPGTTLVEPTGIVCQNQLVNISLDGNTIGAGQDYQLQYSTTLGGTYADEGVSQNTSIFSLNPITTYYYRVAVTCGGQTRFSTPVLVTVADFFPGGTYTIDANSAPSATNFQSFNAAVSAIKCGTTGPIIFNVIAGSGPYVEEVVIPAIQTSSATNTIVFNGNNNILQFDGSITNKTVLTLDGADYITINDLTIKSLNATYGWGILLTHAADNNTINNCIIDVSATSNTASVNSNGVIASNSVTSANSSGDNANFTSIIGCTVIGGYYGVNFYGATGTINSGNIISGNVIKDFYYYGLYSFYNSGLQIIGNDIQRVSTTSVSIFYGVYLGTGVSGTFVDANKIHDTHTASPGNTSSAYGIYVSGDATLGNENVISNNLIYNINTASGTVYGVQNAGGDYCRIYHNTITLKDAASTSGITYGIYNSSTAVGLDIQNNIVDISRGGTGTKYCLYFASATNPIISDYNDLIITSTGGTLNRTGYYTPTGYATLADWQANTTFDDNSVSIDPAYTAPGAGNFIPQQITLDNLGIPVGILTDINNDPRDPSTPDIGAYEFSANFCSDPPTAGTTTSDVTGLICLGSATVNINLTGNSAGLNQTYQLASGDNSAGPFTLQGSIQSTPGFTVSPTPNTYYSIAVSCGNSTIYSTPILVGTEPLLPAGIYTINSTAPPSSTNFVSFTAAANAMACGIDGPIVLNVTSVNATYNEQFRLDSIYNSSAVNTITLNGNNNTITFDNTTSNRAIVILNGADYVKINELNIVSLNATYGIGILLSAGADNNSITNSNINISSVTVATAANSSGIATSNTLITTNTDGNNAINLLVDGNTITGGYYGVSLVNITSQFGTGNIVTNNAIINPLVYGIQSEFQNGALIENNEISRPSSTVAASAAFYGVFLTGGNTGVLVSKNRIHDSHSGIPASSGLAYGIYITGSDAISGAENRFINNIIYNFNSVTGTQYGIYNAGSNFNSIYHNTILLDDANSTGGITRGFYQSTTANNIEFINNIVVISRTGSGSKHAIYLGAAATTIVSNYNDLFITSTGGTTNATGYLSGSTPTDKITLADWQTTGNDAASVAYNPIFENIAVGNLRPQQIPLDNLGTDLSIPTDIQNVSRSATPDLGAYEFTGTLLPVKLISIAAIKRDVDVDINWLVASENNSSHYEVERSLDGISYILAGQVTSNNLPTGGSYIFRDFSATKKATGYVLYYRLKMVDKDSRFEYSPVVKVDIEKVKTNSLEVYPNPFTDFAQLKISSTQASTANYKLYTIDGKMVLMGNVKLVEGINILKLNGTEQLPEGIYTVSVLIDGNYYKAQIIKQ